MQLYFWIILENSATLTKVAPGCRGPQFTNPRLGISVWNDPSLTVSECNACSGHMRIPTYITSDDSCYKHRLQTAFNSKCPVLNNEKQIPGTALPKVRTVFGPPSSVSRPGIMFRLWLCYFSCCAVRTDSARILEACLNSDRVDARHKNKIKIHSWNLVSTCRLKNQFFFKLTNELRIKRVFRN
jgi:hypothetical protein